MREITVLDTSLRDGAQGIGISFSVEDKLKIARTLSQVGVHYIEGGNPFSNPKDLEFFERAGRRDYADRLVAFGSTCRPRVKAEEDESLKVLLSANTKTVSIFGKSSPLHVTEVLKTTQEENLRMIRDTVKYLVDQGRQVFYDAEHFFDGYLEDPEFAIRTLLAAEEAGAAWLVLCDTNGGLLPEECDRIVREVMTRVETPVGIHCHNDIDCAVANSILAVEAGASQVQGTFVGYGERCGNAALCALIPTLQLKKGYVCATPEELMRYTPSARKIADISNVTLSRKMAYVGSGAFAHKGGMHIDGVGKIASSFEHIKPELVGNNRNLLISEMSGRSALVMKVGAMAEITSKDDPMSEKLLHRVKELERSGYAFESAEASLELLVLKESGKYTPYFHLIRYHVMGDNAGEDRAPSSAFVKLEVGGKEVICADEGIGPVNALDKALGQAVGNFYPVIGEMYLSDFKVRVIEAKDATAAVVRVLIESTDGKNIWSTVGVSADIIEASLLALKDSIEYKLMMEET